MFNKVTKSALAIAIATSIVSTNVLASTEWNVSLWGKKRAFTEHVEKLAELVSAKTNGEFTLNISYGGLSKNKENLDGISFGAFEMAQFCAGYHADKNPTITVLELPFLNVNSLDKEVEVSMALYQHPAVVKDLARWNATLLMTSPMPQYNIAGLGDAPTTLEAFDGIRVRATGGLGQAMQAVNAVPTSMSATEVRQSLDSGVITAAAFAPHAHLSFGTMEKATWWTTNLNPGTVNCPVVVNTDALNALSDEHKQALLGSVDEALAHYVDNYNNVTMKKWDALLIEKNIQLITYSDEELAKFRDSVAGPAKDEWIKKQTEAGLPAQELYDFVVNIINN